MRGGRRRQRHERYHSPRATDVHSGQLIGQLVRAILQQKTNNLLATTNIPLTKPHNSTHRSVHDHVQLKQYKQVLQLGVVEQSRMVRANDSSAAAAGVLLLEAPPVTARPQFPDIIT